MLKCFMIASKLDGEEEILSTLKYKSTLQLINFSTHHQFHAMIGEDKKKLYGINQDLLMKVLYQNSHLCLNLISLMHLTDCLANL